jgi:hypothetical protein
LDPWHAALTGLPIVCALATALYVRASSRKIEAVLRSVSDATSSRNNADLQPVFGVAGGNYTSPPDIDCAQRAVATTPGPVPRGTPRTMRDRVQLILEGRHAMVGAPAPLTDLSTRERLAWPLRAARSPVGAAAAAGLDIRAANLPPSDPQVLAGGVLLYRDDADADAWIYFGVAAALLERSSLPATESDAWLLADHLASPVALFERAPLTSRDARA